jgi:hypothetical protein
MKAPITMPRSFMQTRRSLFLLPLALLAGRLMAEPAAPPALPPGACPLNSGGESLLGTEWRLFSLWGNKTPVELNITMKVGENSLSGFGGCNDYTANFKRVGHTGFVMQGFEKGQKSCSVLPTVPGGPTINVGTWEDDYLRILQRAGSVSQEGGMLHFYNRNGDTAVIFTKKYGTP